MTHVDIDWREAEILLLRSEYHVHTQRHRRTERKWRNAVQYRSICNCCHADPVLVSVVRERGRSKRLCLLCYVLALDLYREAVANAVTE